MRQNSTRFLYDEGKRREREELVEEVVHKIETYAGERHLHGKIYGRPKHIYSIYRKMQDKKKRFDEIYDLIAIRCILTPAMFMPCWAISMSSGSQCRVDLRTILPTGRPMAISPSIRSYTALKRPIEFQIRTKEMHEVVEYGVAAHWAYKKRNQGSSQQQGIGYWDELD